MNVRLKLFIMVSANLVLVLLFALSCTTLYWCYFLLSHVQLPLQADAMLS